ncbi:GTP-binding protein [Citricoccus sp. SGAir0253]|uniref:CobW family GTP-binding protein n=1 Tax=Citricoccus sp. SGAir0253 TaxID=2567881 RepID=UPI0010CCC601|nr:GTP-binding protein [Citricoccus sp. SGAir0253]QCU78836.1 GTP-binding protein [Citricoccus sp. SGAir0253]
MTQAMTPSAGRSSAHSPGHRVPVITLAGYLGAGKTTLLNHLLRQPGARLGVVVNDFGTLNVDAALVAGQVDEAAAISGGCLCCLPDAGGLDEALERLSRPRLRLDAIIVEASGAAEPLALARLVRHSSAGRVRPGGLVEVVDATEHFRTVDTLPDPPARHAAASLVVVTKADLLPDSERHGTVERIRRRVAARNPAVPVVLARQGRIDPALVFDTAEHEDPPDQLPIARLLREQANAHDHEHAAAVAVRLDAPVPAAALVDLLEHPPAGAYRLKGRVAVRQPRGDRGYLVNLVGRSIHVAALPAPPEPGELVAIGLGLDTAATRARLEAVAVTAAGGDDAAALRRLQRYRRLSA